MTDYTPPVNRYEPRDPFTGHSPWTLWAEQEQARIDKSTMTRAAALEVAHGRINEWPSQTAWHYDRIVEALTAPLPADRFIEVKDCRRCDRPRWSLGCLAVARNGVARLAHMCLMCGSHQTDKVWRGSLDDLPIIDDHRDHVPGCARCGELGVEEHHWAPRHLFDDFGSWPTSYLCRSCHQEWHRVVTPNMSQRKAS